MAESAPHICGISGRHMSPNEGHQLIRLHEDDIEPGDTGADGGPLKPGLYHASQAMVKKFQPRVAKRLMRTPLIGADGHKVPKRDGSNEIVIENGKVVYEMTITDPSQAAGNMLV